MEAQEIFDRTVSHLRKQAARCLDSEGNSLYRNNSGYSCAIGHFFTDADFITSIENKAVVDLCGNLDFINTFGIASKDDPKMSLLNELQLIHDAHFNVKTWEAQFQRVAEDFNLNYQPPTT